MQKRSAQKVTFPNHVTNTCCSHPLHEIAEEREETNALGVRKAAARRLNHELGIPLQEIHPDRFQYLTRIHYCDPGDGQWGEHEIDYILVLHADVTLQPNPDEVSETNYKRKKKGKHSYWTKNKTQIPISFKKVNVLIGENTVFPPVHPPRITVYEAVTLFLCTTSADHSQSYEIKTISLIITNK